MTKNNKNGKPSGKISLNRNKLSERRLPMKIIITEEMRFRQKVVEFAIKHDNNATVARRYHTSRQQVQRWRKKYDGTVQSLAQVYRKCIDAGYKRSYESMSKQIKNLETIKNQRK